jgi:hypothetical protein
VGRLAQLVEIDDEVWNELKARAEPFVDTPNSVLRRLLGLSPDGADAERRLLGTHVDRAPIGSLLPEAEYVLPILRVLVDRGGSAPAKDVVAAVGGILADRLKDRDRETLPNGGQRWQNRIQFSRLKMKERGLLKRGSPRGLWEITDAGVQLVAEQGVEWPT